MQEKPARISDQGLSGFDYEILERLRGGTRSCIYRARHTQTNETVILKTVVEEMTTQDTAARMKREFSLAERLSGTVLGAIRVDRLVLHAGAWFMVMEDIGGESLDRVAIAGSLDLIYCLRLLAKVAATLDGIHALNIVHKDISPSNIVVNLHKNLVRVIDFGSASELSRETPNFCEPDMIEGTLAYISPEQTGRMNRGLDDRTDFYSLGATFYHVLTGKPPFEGEDAMELLHAHIARTPEPPHRVAPKIPEIVSKLILKLLAKNADDRYQSGSGLVKDIDEVIRRIEQALPTDDFIPGRYDLPRRFRISQKLYGRDAEITTLMSAFERVSQGAAELLLVAGYSGIGKSSLVHEVHKPITQKHGFYIAGKFDQLQKNIPYSAILSALTSLLEQRLTEPEERVLEWRSSLKRNLGDLGGVIFDFLPGAELLLGPMPAVPSAGPAEAEKRFLSVFVSFLQVFCDEKHPLVLFLDDLQWADTASLKLIQSLLTADGLHHILLVGAYRDNEVDSAHPLVRTLRAIDQAHTRITTITLGNLLDEHIRELLADSLGCSVEQASTLSTLIFEKTQGNAFFLTQFLQSLHDDGLLVCEAREASADDGGSGRPWIWTWQIEKLRARAITENVVELVARRIAGLPKDQQRVLSLASCLGNRFDLEKLAIACECAQKQLITVLWPILEDGLLLPLDEHYKLVAVADGAAHLEVSTFRFLHDRVQEAAYLLIDPQLRPETHLKIGRLLRTHLPHHVIEEQIFVVVAQFESGLALITDLEEAIAVARLHLIAARKAKAAMAFSTAVKVLLAGALALAKWQPWETQFELNFEIHNELALCEYLTGRFEESDIHFHMLCEKARTTAQIGKVYGEAVYLHTTMNEYDVAIQLTREGLGRLGMKFPIDVTPEIVGQELAVASETLGNRRVADLLHLPLLEDPDLVAPFSILNMAIPPCWLAMPAGFAWCTLQMVNLSQRYGNTAISAFGYGIYALLLCGGPEQYELGLQYGELAIALNERLPDAFIKGTIHFFYSCFVQHWRRHKSLNLPLHDIAERFCTESGANVYGVYNVIFFFFQSFYANRSLAEVQDQYEGKHALVKRVGDEDVSGVLGLLGQLTRNMMDETEPDASLDDEHFQEATYFAELEAREYGNGLCYFHFVKMLANFYAERFDDALDCAERLLPYYVYTHGLYHRFLFHFYRGLAITAVFPDTSGDQRARLSALLAFDRDFLTKCASECPANFEAQRALLVAEIARVEGRFIDALQLFQVAATRAAEDDNLPGQAIAEELLAKFCMAQGLVAYAHTHAGRAISAYAAWGAIRKLAVLRARYETLFTTPILPVRLPVGQAVLERIPFYESPRPKTRPSTLKHIEIDVESLLESSYVLAREVELDQLLRKVMRVIIMHAGANRGALVLSRKDGLFVEAEFTWGEGSETILASCPLAESRGVPHTMVLLAYRKGESLHVTDLSKDQRFADDPYIVRTNIRSALCIPLDVQNERMGVVYLENDAVAAALTERSLKVTQLLSTHAAISIRNALHIAKLKTASEELTLHNEALQLQRAAIVALSVPVLEVGDGILAVPLIGNLDISRMDHVATSLLEEIGRRQARAVIIDTTGLATVDETTVRHLLNLARMMRLLGSQMLLTGIRPNIARSIIADGAELSGVRTVSSLKEALASLGRRVSARA